MNNKYPNPLLENDMWSLKNCSYMHKKTIVLSLKGFSSLDIIKHFPDSEHIVYKELNTFALITVKKQIKLNVLE